jgi:beta-galactosidase
VWEWIDHGFTHTDAAGRTFIMHGTDVAYRPNGGRYCLDGLVFADRTPKPALAEYAQAVTPVELEVDASGLGVRSGYDHVGLEHLAFAWRLELDGIERARGALDVPALAPGESARLAFPSDAMARAAGDEPGEWWLTVEAALATDAAWAPAGHVVARRQGLVAGRPRVPTASAAVGRAAGAQHDGDVVRLGPATFDAASGRLVRLGALDLDGPRLDVYRAPIENDRGQGGVNDLAAVWSAVGLDRMLDRTDAVEVDGERLRVAGRLAAATHPHAVEYAFEWTADGDGVVLAASVAFTGPWADTPFRHRDIVLPRLGLRLGLPGSYGTASWFGRGPGESYVDSTDAAAIGRWTAAIDELQVRYPVPQENGNHVDTRWLELTGQGVPTLRVDGDPVFDFAARRWTSEDLERARHPHDLVDSGRVWLNVDHRQLGLGSASVGPAIPERYRIPRERTTWRVRFSAG